MTAQEVLALVNDFAGWKGNTYTLAMLVMQRQKEDDAAIADTAEQPAVAEAIRGQ